MGLMFRELICAVFGHKPYSYPMIAYPPKDHAVWRVWIITRCNRCRHVLSKELSDKEYVVQ